MSRKRPSMITDSNQVCFVKMIGRRVQGRTMGAGSVAKSIVAPFVHTYSVGTSRWWPAPPGQEMAILFRHGGLLSAVQGKTGFNVDRLMEINVSR